MPWFRLLDSFYADARLVDLATCLGSTLNAAAGVVARLYAYASRYHVDGDVTALLGEDHGDLLDCDARLLCDGLVAAGLVAVLDGRRFVLVDWDALSGAEGD